MWVLHEALFNTHWHSKRQSIIRLHRISGPLQPNVLLEGGPVKEVL